MTVTIERASGFYDIPERYQSLALVYLVGKKFDHLDEALRQTVSDGFSLYWHGFGIGDRIIMPQDLLEVLPQTDIFVSSPYGKKDVRVSALVAKVTDEEPL